MVEFTNIDKSGSRTETCSQGTTASKERHADTRKDVSDAPAPASPTPGRSALNRKSAQVHIPSSSGVSEGTPPAKETPVKPRKVSMLPARSKSTTTARRKQALGVIQRVKSESTGLRERVGADHYVDPGQLTYLSLLGQGAFATVKKCEMEDPRTSGKETVAVKMLKPEVAGENSEISAFVREAAVLSKLKHQNIVRYRGLGSFSASADQTTFMVQEFMKGGSLKRLLLKQTAAPERLLFRAVDGLRWLLNIARALAYLHSCRPMLIHRDIKSDNIMLSESNPLQADAKLGDFGLHKLVDVEEGRAVEGVATVVVKVENTFSLEIIDNPAKAINNRVTSKMSFSAKVMRSYKVQAGRGRPQVRGELAPDAALPVLDGSVQQLFELTGVCGSLLYMAPEVFRGLPYNEKVDIFSFGMIAYEVFCRTHVLRLLVPGKQPQRAAKEFAQKVAAGWRPDLPPDLHPDVRSLIQHCWRGEPCHRPSGSELVKELEHLQELDVFGGEPGKKVAPACGVGCGCSIM